MENNRVLFLTFLLGCLLFRAASAQAKRPDFFYQRYEGDIRVGGEKIPIILNLSRDSIRVAGNYYYCDQGVLIDLSGTISRDSIKLSEYVKQECTGIFSGAFTAAGEITGVWQNPAATKKHIFQLSEIYPAGSVKAEMRRLGRVKQVYQNQARATLCYPVLSGIASQNIERKISAAIQNGISAEAVLEHNLASMSEDMKNTYAETETAPSDWYYNEAITIVFNSRSVLGLQSCIEEYSGGAHPNHVVSYSNIDLSSGDKLSMADLFREASGPDLLLIAAQVFKNDNHMEPGQTLEDAGFWFEDDRFFLPDNFLITAGGIKFVYNEYEIAPYAAGAIELFLPYSKIKALIKPGSIIEKFIR